MTDNTFKVELLTRGFWWLVGYFLKQFYTWCLSNKRIKVVIYGYQMIKTYCPFWNSTSSCGNLLKSLPNCALKKKQCWYIIIPFHFDKDWSAGPIVMKCKLIQILLSDLNLELKRQSKVLYVYYYKNKFGCFGKCSGVRRILTRVEICWIKTKVRWKLTRIVKFWSWKRF